MRVANTDGRAVLTQDDGVVDAAGGVEPFASSRLFADACVAISGASCASRQIVVIDGGMSLR
jgi:hypothetical protein